MTDPDRARRAGPRELGVTVTGRYRFQWLVIRGLIGALFKVRAEGLENWPAPPFQLVCNHHNGWDPFLLGSVAPLRPRITWFGPRELDFSRGFKNRMMGFFGGMIPFHPRTSLTSAVRAVQRVFAAHGVLAIFAEGRIGFRETALLPLQEGATVFAITSEVPIVPCAIIGSIRLWFRCPIIVRFGEPIPAVAAHDRAARQALEATVRDALAALLPKDEPPVPDRMPLAFLTDLFNGPADVARRRAYLAGEAGEAEESEPQTTAGD